MANRKHYNLQQMVAGGYSSDHTFNHKFGACPSISINTTGTIWDVEDTLYPWTALDTPSVVSIERTDAADDGHTVTVQGLDADWNFLSEEIVISGANTLGTSVFRRVNRAFCSSATAVVNTGDIHVRAGSSTGAIVAKICENLGQTLMAVYTIPAGYIGYLYKGTCSVQANADATVNMFVRRNTIGRTFRVAHTFEVSGTGGQYMYDFAFPPALPEKSDIDVRALMRSNNGRITAAFDILLVENDPEAPITDLL